VSDRVTWRIEGGVADVRLNRPDKLNAVDGEMFRALGDAGDALAADPAVRVVVLSGEGRGFCAGLDVAAFAGDGLQGMDDLLGGRHGGRISNRAQHAAWVWQEVPVPVIAAVHGVALGAGIQIALGADLRLVAADARLSVMEVRWGLIPDMTGTWSLPRAVGPDVAKELIWTGRMVSGEEAVRLGLATRVAADPRGEALALAAELAGRSPSALRAAKALVNQSLQATAGEQLRAESVAITALIGSPDQMEAVRSQLEGRPPEFGGQTPP
jgi:enoyl-CoA hydratase/carnithine racemase